MASRARTSPWRAAVEPEQRLPRRALRLRVCRPSAQLLSERGDIDDGPLFHDAPGRETEETHSLDTDARAVARHAAGGHGVRANHLPVHRDQVLVGDGTLYGHLEIRDGRSPGPGRCAVLLEGVVGRGS